MRTFMVVMLAVVVGQFLAPCVLADAVGTSALSGGSDRPLIIIPSASSAFFGGSSARSVDMATTPITQTASLPTTSGTTIALASGANNGSTSSTINAPIVLEQPAVVSLYGSDLATSLGLGSSILTSTNTATYASPAPVFSTTGTMSSTLSYYDPYPNYTTSGNYWDGITNNGNCVVGNTCWLYLDNFMLSGSTVATPEPSSLVLLLVAGGLLAVGHLRRRVSR